MDVLTENDDAIVGFHPTIHHPSYGVDELDLGRFPREVLTIGPAQPLEFAEISANADIHKGWSGHSGLLDSALVWFPVGNGFGQFAQNPGHQILRSGGDILDLLVVHDPAPDQMTGNLIYRIPRSPLGLFLLGPVAERASGKGPFWWKKR